MTMRGIQTPAATWTVQAFDSGCARLTVRPGGGGTRGQLSTGKFGPVPVDVAAVVDAVDMFAASRYD